MTQAQQRHAYARISLSSLVKLGIISTDALIGITQQHFFPVEVHEIANTTGQISGRGSGGGGGGGNDGGGAAAEGGDRDSDDDGGQNSDENEDAAFYNISQNVFRRFVMSNSSDPSFHSFKDYIAAASQCHSKSYSLTDIFIDSLPFAEVVYKYFEFLEDELTFSNALSAIDLCAEFQLPTLELLTTQLPLYWIQGYVEAFHFLDEEDICSCCQRLGFSMHTSQYLESSASSELGRTQTLKYWVLNYIEGILEYENTSHPSFFEGNVSSTEVSSTILYSITSKHFEEPVHFFAAKGERLDNITTPLEAPRYERGAAGGGGGGATGV